MTAVVFALVAVVLLLAIAVFVLLRVVLNTVTGPPSERRVILGVLSTEETIQDLRAAVDDLTTALADAGRAGTRIDQSTKELEP